MNKAEETLLRFMDTAEDLLSLVSHENAILLEKGGLTFEAYIAHKVGLMRKFEVQAETLLQEPSLTTSMHTKLLMLDEIRKVRDALKINSAFHLELLQQGNTVIPVSAQSEKPQEVTACH